MKKVTINTINPEESLRCFGVYSIECKTTKKIYIGSTAASFRERWTAHIRLLNLYKHANKKLQNAWLKYGSNEFLFSIIEISQDKSSILMLEQKHIDSHQTKHLFNIALKAGNTLGTKQRFEQIDKKSKVYVYVKPTGEIIRAKNMRNFCKENNLRQNHIVNVANNKILHHKGWLAYHEQDFTLEKMKLDLEKMKKPTYHMVHSNGNEVTTQDLKSFALMNNLDYATIYNVLSGRMKQYKGWKINKLPNE